VPRLSRSLRLPQACAVAALALGGAGLGAPQAWALPPGMAYEKVTPADKGGGQIWPGSQTIHASATGDRVAYKAPVAFPGAVGSAFPSDYLAVAFGGPPARLSSMRRSGVRSAWGRRGR
jgi:hypothetical protein